MLSNRRGVAILLVSAAASHAAACAPIGRNWSRVVQPPATARPEGVSPGSWVRVEALQPESPLVVTLKSGNRLEGRFKSLESATLALTNRGGQEFGIARSTVAKIAMPVRDGVANGALIGAGIGLGVAMAILATLGSRDGYVLPSAKVGAPLLLSGAGGLLGALVDRAHAAETVVYAAP